MSDGYNDCKHANFSAPLINLCNIESSDLTETHNNLMFVHEVVCNVKSMGLICGDVDAINLLFRYPTIDLFSGELVTRFKFNEFNFNLPINELKDKIAENESQRNLIIERYEKLKNYANKNDFDGKSEEIIEEINDKLLYFCYERLLYVEPSLLAKLSVRYSACNEVITAVQKESWIRGNYNFSNENMESLIEKEKTALQVARGGDQPGAK